VQVCWEAVADTWHGSSKAYVAECVVCTWNSARSVSCTLSTYLCMCVCCKVILQERESRRQKFLRDVMDGRFESRVVRYMPAVTADDDDAVNDGLSAAVCTVQPAAAAVDDAVGVNLSSAARRAMLLSRIHSRRFRELVLNNCKIHPITTTFIY